jgi:hypothetical protein
MLTFLRLIGPIFDALKDPFKHFFAFLNESGTTNNRDGVFLGKYRHDIKSLYRVLGRVNES